jgi:formylglycine-generating enzyme required for sulfatase activity
MPDPGARKFDTGVEGLALDRSTGLTWQRQVAPEQLDWGGAQGYCDCLELAGFNDWRLPTRIELISLIDYRRQEPSIDVEAFPETPSTWFWSSSPVAEDPLVAWYLSFMDGNTHEADRHMTYGVRCVRGGVPPHRSYEISGEIVTDPNTHLTWQRALDGQVRAWDEASAYCSTLTLAGGGWRLPTMSELQSLIDETVTAPAIDQDAFPATPGEGFWAGTPLAGMAPYRWFVSFDRGIAYNALPNRPYNVRCVR